MGLSSVTYGQRRKAGVLQGLRERIKQLRMEHLFEEPCPLYEEEDDE